MVKYFVYIDATLNIDEYLSIYEMYLAWVSDRFFGLGTQLHN